MDKKDLNIEVEEGVLTVSGEKSHGFDENGPKSSIYSRELKHSSFKRQFTLGEMLDGDNISPNFKDGILSIEIPKIEPTLPKRTLSRLSNKLISTNNRLYYVLGTVSVDSGYSPINLNLCGNLIPFLGTMIYSM